uniref:Succinate dehydrogenase [ubiquinone] cytochrome b small subunit n=1 Tax=Timema bartmani TaxID=61472 RepID=A0A7R9I680_9NEOP|nr:unnamed protein product [Timema bartmani]
MMNIKGLYINECTQGLHSCNPESESCSNTPGGYDCLCRWGYLYNQSEERCIQNELLMAAEAGQINRNGVLDALKGYKGHLVYYKNARGFSTSTPALSSHDHTKLWTAERALSASLLPLFPAALLYPCQALDCALAITLVMHNHWGVEANVVDYIRPKMFGPIIPKVAIFGLYGLSIATLAGLFYFIFNDVGIASFIRMFWRS